MEHDQSRPILIEGVEYFRTVCGDCGQLAWLPLSQSLCLDCRRPSRSQGFWLTPVTRGDVHRGLMGVKPHD